MSNESQLIFYPNEGRLIRLDRDRAQENTRLLLANEDQWPQDFKNYFETATKEIMRFPGDQVVANTILRWLLEKPTTIT